MPFRIVVTFLSMIIITLSSPTVANSYQQGNYPRFSNAKLFTTGETVSGRPNVVLSAIENGTSIDLGSTGRLSGVKQYLFPSKNFGSNYTVDKLASTSFTRSISNVVGEFACAEYRFRNRLPESDGCNGYVHDDGKKEGMPFVSGQFQSNPLETHIDDQVNGISFTTYLKSVNDVPLNSAFGSVHEMGEFFGKFANKKSIILSVNLEAYWWSTDKQRTNRINIEPEVYFIVLPKSVDIANQRDQNSAAKFAIENSKILIIK
ncbi:hypothetical protein [Vibrio sp. F74]|uniref:hypothetical protein n=1 Tax=Vibrio sp. F74 TaxID=700020 RepID=UPI0035F5CB7F